MRAGINHFDRGAVMRSPLLLLLAVVLLALVVPATAQASGGGQLSWSPALSSFASGEAAAAAPVITRLSFSSAEPGARLTISGRGFGAKRGTSSLLFGSFKATSYALWSATRITCKVPVIPAGGLQVMVRVARRTSKGKRFTVRPLPLVIPKTTDVLSAASVASASTTDGSTYTFTDTSQTGSLKPGDVIVGAPSASLPGGVMRKVTAVAADGASVTTTPATLDQVFTSAQFSADHALTQSDFTGTRVAPGVRLVRSRAQRPDLLTFRLKNVNITKSADLSSNLGPVTVSGTITLSITVHVAAAIGRGGVKSFQTSETSTVSSDLKASVTKDVGLSKEQTVASWGIGKIAGFYVLVGVPPVVVPLYFQPKLSIFVGANGRFGAGVETRVRCTASGNLGVSWQPDVFSPWYGFSASKSYDPPKLFASGSLKTYAGTQVGLSLYDAAGPDLRLDTYANLSADTRLKPWWTLKAGLEGSIGFELGINESFLHWSKNWKSGNLKLAEWTLAQATTPPPEPTVRWFVRSYNVDDTSWIYVDGELVAAVPYLGDSGWSDVTDRVRSTGNATSLRFLTYNGPEGYAWGYEVGRQIGDAPLAVVWKDEQGVAGITGANNNDQTQTDRYVYDRTLTVGELLP